MMEKAYSRILMSLFSYAEEADTLKMQPKPRLQPLRGMVPVCRYHFEYSVAALFVLIWHAYRYWPFIMLEHKRYLLC